MSEEVLRVATCDSNSSRRNVILNGPRQYAHSLWSPSFFFLSFFASFFLWGLADVWSCEAARLWPGVASNRVPLFLAAGQSLCQVSTYRSTWIFSGLRRNDKPCLLFLRFCDLVARRNTIPISRTVLSITDRFAFTLSVALPVRAARLLPFYRSEMNTVTVLRCVSNVYFVNCLPY